MEGRHDHPYAGHWGGTRVGEGEVVGGRVSLDAASGHPPGADRGAGVVGRSGGAADGGDRGVATVDLRDGGGVQPEAGATGEDDRSGGEVAGESDLDRG